MCGTVESPGVIQQLPQLHYRHKSIPERISGAKFWWQIKQLLQRRAAGPWKQVPVRDMAWREAHLDLFFRVCGYFLNIIGSFSCTWTWSEALTARISLLTLHGIPTRVNAKHNWFVSGQSLYFTLKIPHSIRAESAFALWEKTRPPPLVVCQAKYFACWVITIGCCIDCWTQWARNVSSSSSSDCFTHVRSMLGFFAFACCAKWFSASEHHHHHHCLRFHQWKLCILITQAFLSKSIIYFCFLCVSNCPSGSFRQFQWEKSEYGTSEPHCRNRWSCLPADIYFVISRFPFCSAKMNQLYYIVLSLPSILAMHTQTKVSVILKHQLLSLMLESHSRSLSCVTEVVKISQQRKHNNKSSFYLRERNPDSAVWRSQTSSFFFISHTSVLRYKLLCIFIVLTERIAHPIPVLALITPPPFANVEIHTGFVLGTGYHFELEHISITKGRTHTRLHVCIH